MRTRHILTLLLAAGILGMGSLGPELLLNRIRQGTLEEEGELAVSVDAIRPYGEELIEQIAHLEKVARMMDDMQGDGITWEELSPVQWTDREITGYRDGLAGILQGEGEILFLNSLSFSNPDPAENKKVQKDIFRSAAGDDVELGVWSCFSPEGDSQEETVAAFDLDTGMPVLLELWGECTDFLTEDIWEQILLYYNSVSGMNFHSVDLSPEAVGAFSFLMNLAEDSYAMVESEVESMEEFDNQAGMDSEEAASDPCFYGAVTGDGSFGILTFLNRDPDSGRIHLALGFFGPVTVDRLALIRTVRS